jgi:hypothetical protein
MRLVPADLREARGWGPEPGGGLRGTVVGVRFLVSGDALLTASARLPAAPSDVVTVPRRMGGGFLFVMGAQVWRSETWLGPVRPLVQSASAVGDVLVGLDRAYLLSASGTLSAFDPQSGTGEDIGPLPSSPRMGQLAAVDAWRAVAIADFRGAMLTLDAGQSWHPLELGDEPLDVSTSGSSIVVRGVGAERRTEWWEIGPDGQASRLPAAPAPPSMPTLQDVIAHRLGGPLGADPLGAAIEDGWPLADRTALVARDGALARVRLDDGTYAQVVAEAFALRPSRCHAVSLATPSEPGAFGFVCGEPRGQTVVYRWDAAHASLATLRAFDTPRQILAFGNGSLAARGSCAADAPDPDGESTADVERAWCVMTSGGGWTERRFRGERVSRARIVVLADGRVALVRPPDGELATARLTVVDGPVAEHRALHFPLLRDDVAKALVRGVWLDGFEERRPGVLGGWVDAAGAVVGVEIALDGTVRVGEYIRDAGAPVASGRWAFGWTGSRRAFETTDGGMTWTKSVDVPEPIAPIGATAERACGPVGCIAAGWLKVGWSTGAPAEPSPAWPPTLLARGARRPPALRLECERGASEAVGPPGLGGGVRPGFGQPSLILPGASLPAFCGMPGPARPSDAPAVVSEIAEGLGWSRRVSPVGMVYVWGPPGGDWDKLGRWEVRWRSPTAGCGVASSVAPWVGPDAASRALGRAGASAPALTLASGEDASHALLLERRPGGFDLLALDSGHAPRAIRRADGDVFPDIEAVRQFGGRWYVVSAQAPSEIAATVVWRLDGDSAREVGRFPRLGPQGRMAAHLARRAQGHAIGVVVEGRPDATQPPRLWLDSVDPETGEIAAPEPLAPLDFGGGAADICTGDDDGWQLDLPYAGNVQIDLLPHATAELQSVLLTIRVSSSSACIEHMAGAWSDDLPTVAAGPPTSHLPSGRFFDVDLASARDHVSFRCRLP